MTLNADIRKTDLGPGEMAQWLTELAVLPEDLGLSPRTPKWWFMSICNSNSRGSDGAQIRMQAKHPYI